ncbi:MAG: H-NS histone family protein [Ferrovum sp.]|nr:H-NS histone family protein [Ferrovum sp.]NDU87288.1 H-NS histone family protein [Ferrovum sp.]
MATYEKLMEQAEELRRQAESVRQQEIQAIVMEIREKIRQFGITAKDLGFSTAAGSRGANKAGTVRYRGPNGEIWKGKGRRPEWLNQAISAGRNKSDFAV